MKRSILFVALLGFALAGLAPAQPQFRTGQAARALIGQPTFTAQLPGVRPDSTKDDVTPTERLLGAASGLTVVNDMLIVADSSRVGATPDNNRVLIFKNLSQQIPALTAEIGPATGRCPICVGVADIVLGQRDFKSSNVALTATGMRTATAVHSDGRYLAVADTDNNRVLIWNSIPTQSGQAADVVLGQENFTTLKRVVTDNRSFRGPQGVWIQDGRLFVADTQNHRVMIWNRIPTSNHAPADIVLGQPDFNTAPESSTNISQIIIGREAKAESLLNPVSVTSDGVRLFVADLGNNRVLVWNSLPTRNTQPADLVIGQPDFTSNLANNASKLCAANGKDADGKDTFPFRCSKTLDFPRYVLSDGTRLFISDGGNDRILVYNRIPTQNAPAADVILGQLSETLNLTTDNPEGPEAFPNRATAADVVRTPGALAWANGNLYVADPYNRRVLVYTPAEQKVPPTGVRNAASREVFAVAAVTFAGTLKENDEVTVKVGETEYKYKVTKADAERNTDFRPVITGLVNAINASNDGRGDPNALATANLNFLTLVLTARVAGEDGNKVALETRVSDGATIQATGSGATFQGGQDAAAIAPGAIVTILAPEGGLAEESASAPPEFAQLPLAPGANPKLPLELAGVQVYFDGIRAPLLYVSPTEIRAQLPWEVVDTTSVTGWVRTRRRDGSVSVTTAVSVPVIQQNPGIFAEPGVDPRPGFVYHTSSFGAATVSVDGTAQANDTASIIINGRKYSYVVKTADVPAEDRPASEGLQKIRDGLINAINADGGDPDVEAFAAGAFTRIRLRARVEGPSGNGIPVRAETNEGAQVIMTAFNSETCCANAAGARVTEDNPALPGQTITVYATGLGLVIPTDSNSRNDKIEVITGEGYTGTEQNVPVEFVSSLAGGRTANVIFARLVPGSIGIYEVQLELNTDLPTNPATQLTIAQSFQVSNIITFPVSKPSGN